MDSKSKSVKETFGDRAKVPSRDVDFEAYLLAELSHLADSLLRNEEDGERRVAFFVTLTGATVAALGLVLREGGARGFSHTVAAGALLVLLLLGRLTFLRIVQRNRVSDEYRRALARVRSYFLDGPGDPRLAYIPFDPFSKGGRKPYNSRSFRNGGWMETVATLNALLFAGLVLVLAHWGVGMARGGEDDLMTWLVAGTLGIAAGIQGWRTQLRGANRRLGLDRRMEGKGFEREVEVALMIVAPAPELIVEEIAALRSIGAARLEPAPTVKIRDVYFDYPDERLRREGLALRLREVDGIQLVTIKGKGRQRSDGTIERTEIEGTWSPPVVHRMIGVLRSHGAVPGVRSPGPGLADPFDGILSLGLTVIQERTTVRRLRRIHVRGQRGSPIGELAIDEVRYLAGGRAVHIHEVEIEAKREGGDAAVGALANWLIEAFPSSLRRWQHSKLATGRALEELAAKRQLDSLVGPGSTLLPAGFDVVDDRLGNP